MKRKEVDVDDDFSDFSLPSTASTWNKEEKEKAIVVYKQHPANLNLPSPTSNFLYLCCF